MKLSLPVLLLSALAVAVPGLAVPAPAAAQNIPGFSGDYDQAEAQFRAYALAEFQKVLTGWTEAVREGDVDQAMEYYTSNAFAYFTETARGSDQIRRQLTAWLDAIDDFRIGLTDFDASGSISYSSVSIVVNAVNPDDDGDGTMIFVLRRHGRNWLIRSQTLVMN